MPEGQGEAAAPLGWARWPRPPAPAHPANAEAFLICAVVGLPVTKGSPCPGLFAHSHSPHTPRRCRAAPPVPAAGGRSSPSSPPLDIRSQEPTAAGCPLPAAGSCPRRHPAATLHHARRHSCRWHSCRLPVLSNTWGRPREMVQWHRL